MRILVFMLVLTLAVVCGGVWLWQDMERELNEPLQVAGEPQRFVVEQGTSLQHATAQLAQRGILTHPLYLVLDARLNGLAQRIRAGEYEIEPGMTPRDLLTAMVEGRVVQYTITFVEGWTFTQMLAALDRHDALQHDLTGKTVPEIMALLGHPDLHPEGRFFPDSYQFPRGVTDTRILRRAFERMEQILSDLWKEKASGLPYDSPYDALILASIVEKETAVAAERAAVAGVLVRRLQANMKLQTDPTVIYGLGPAFDGNLRRADLEADNPYNTYRHTGLTPTPIAMPGRAAIEAALHPGVGNALYFVSKGDGTHYFSETIDEHNRAVALYQLNRGAEPRTQ